MKRIWQLLTIQNECAELFRKKNHDYGDSFAEYGAIGILIRLGDKLKRLQTITATKIQLVDDEQLRDTLLDMINYATMAIMLLDESENSNV